jgi:hypothetical protein
MSLDMAEKIGTSRSISDSRRWSPGGGQEYAIAEGHTALRHAARLLLNHTDTASLTNKRIVCLLSHLISSSCPGSKPRSLNKRSHQIASFEAFDRARSLASVVDVLIVFLLARLPINWPSKQLEQVALSATASPRTVGESGIAVRIKDPMKNSIKCFLVGGVRFKWPKSNRQKPRNVEICQRLINCGHMLRSRIGQEFGQFAICTGRIWTSDRGCNLRRTDLALRGVNSLWCSLQLIRFQIV